MVTNDFSSKNNKPSREDTLEFVRVLNRLYDDMRSMYVKQDDSDSVRRFDSLFHIDSLELGEEFLINSIENMANTLYKHASFPAVILECDLLRSCCNPKIDIALLISNYNMHITPAGMTQFVKYLSDFQHEHELYIKRTKKREDNLWLYYADKKYFYHIETNKDLMSARLEYYLADRIIAKKNIEWRINYIFDSAAMKKVKKEWGVGKHQIYYWKWFE